MNKVTAYVFGCAATVGLLTLARPANAVGVGGFAGKPLFSNEASCFSESYGTVIQNGSSGCTGSVAWQVQLPVSSGHHNPTIGVFFNDFSTPAAGIDCEVDSQLQDTNNGVAYESSGYVVPPGASGSVNYNPAASLNSGAGVNVPSNGFLFVNCIMEPGSSLLSINY